MSAACLSGSQRYASVGSALLSDSVRCTALREGKSTRERANAGEGGLGPGFPTRTRKRTEKVGAYAEADGTKRVVRAPVSPWTVLARRQRPAGNGVGVRGALQITPPSQFPLRQS